MKEDDLLYTLALQKIKGVGDINAKKLIEVFESPKNIFSETKSALEKINNVGMSLSRGIADKNIIVTAEKELEKIQQNKLVPLYFLNSDYPKKLQHCIDSPILLFRDGNFEFDNPHIISVVGTRKMTNYGRDFCVDLIAGLREYNPMIVSGFAYGVDICAHKAAFENNLQTIGVLAHGFAQIYPKVHKKYMQSMYENGGFLSEFWFDEQPLRENFLKRNRIVAGISSATVVVESAARGGSLSTATIANSYNRDVFALPGRSTDVYSRGCNNLIKNNKAAMVTSAEDLIQFLGWKKKQPTVVQQKLFEVLTADEKKVFHYLKPKLYEHLDTIALDCQILVHKAAAILFQLEMKGMVRPLPGKRFEVI